MRALFVSNFREDRNAGAAGALFAVGDAMTARGHHVDYAWATAPLYRTFHPTLANAIELPIRQLRQVERAMAEREYDVVDVSQPYGFLIPRRLRARYPNTIFVNRTHGWEARVYEQYRRFGWDGERSAAREAVSRASELSQRAMCRQAARSFDGVVTASTKCARFVTSTYGLSPSRVGTTCYGVVSSDLREARDAPPLAERRDRALFVGNYLGIKGARVLERVLPRVASAFPALRVTCVVNRDAVDVARRALEPALGERLTVRSWLPRSELAALYASHAIYLFPSLFEGFGMAFLEAMAAGACVVGFNEGGLPDVARDGIDAHVVDSGNAAAFEASLSRALSQPEETHAIGAAARERARGLTWANTAQTYETFLSGLRRQLQCARV